MNANSTIIPQHTLFCDLHYYSMSYFAVNPEVIVHSTGARTSSGRLAESTNRTVSSTEAPLDMAVLTTERKAA
jgi:hypothetical protein